MADSIRAQIMAKVDTLLKTIKTTAGYETNLGSKIYEWRDMPIEDDAPPACIYKESDSYSMFATNQWKHSLALEIILFGNTATQVRQMIADIIKAIGTKTTWDGLALRTEPTAEDTGVEQKNKLLFVSHLTFTIDFVSTYWNAYS